MKTLEEIKREFDEEFNFDTVFGTDNFEDQEYINHPCYAHAGVIKEFRKFLVRAVSKSISQTKQELIEEIRETISNELYKNGAITISVKNRINKKLVKLSNK